jgi:hypothetical protein
MRKILKTGALGWAFSPLLVGCLPSKSHCNSRFPLGPFDFAQETERKATATATLFVFYFYFTKVGIVTMPTLFGLESCV